MFSTSEIAGYAGDGWRVRGLSGDALFSALKEELPKVLEEEGIPAIIREDTLKSGGLFGTKVPILAIWYPSPPSSFFIVGITINGNVISFPLLGYSAETEKMNKKRVLEQEGKFIRSALIHPDELILQQEKAWHRSIVDCVSKLFS